MTSSVCTKDGREVILQDVVCVIDSEARSVHAQCDITFDAFGHHHSRYNSHWTHRTMPLGFVATQLKLIVACVHSLLFENNPSLEFHNTSSTANVQRGCKILKSSSLEFKINLVFFIVCHKRHPSCQLCSSNCSWNEESGVYDNILHVSLFVHKMGKKVAPSSSSSPPVSFESYVPSVMSA